MDKSDSESDDDDELLGEKLLRKGREDGPAASKEEVADQLAEIAEELRLTADDLQKSQDLGDFKLLKKAVNLKKGLMRSYRTYLSYWLLWKYETNFGKSQTSITREQDRQVEA